MRLRLAEFARARSSPRPPQDAEHLALQPGCWHMVVPLPSFCCCWEVSQPLGGLVVLWADALHQVGQALADGCHHTRPCRGLKKGSAWITQLHPLPFRHFATVQRDMALLSPSLSGERAAALRRAALPQQTRRSKSLIPMPASETARARLINSACGPR